MCEKSFAGSSELTRHNTAHTGEKLYNTRYARNLLLTAVSLQGTMGHTLVKNHTNARYVRNLLLTGLTGVTLQSTLPYTLVKNHTNARYVRNLLLTAVH